ncbi:thioredoxin family protein [Rhodobium gokarnense]|uniref:Thioredoxin-related protein n=1 Tax=Rhodobium gokarnense TaxID=364296 RepID=A0ABT3HCG8_9HYPH|nr:thioredoxin family protein [Rhodobium gokarnense]MCW2308102.1 thioredoxin-related protein [Rhodobium gokarnense]
MGEIRLGAFIAGAAVASVVFFGLVAAGIAEDMPEPKVGDNGLHTQSWFHESFLDMADDLAEAKAEGKHLAVIFEQRGCPYCREMHRVNLTRPSIVDYLKEHYYVVQLDLWGSREVTDFDGEAMEERALARKWRITYTPTISFFSNEVDLSSGDDGRDLETARMPGYFKPFHFLSMFQYVAEGDWKEEHFQKFIQAKFDELKEAGKTPEVWE